MIITLTGKPCSGKGDASKLFAKKYHFKRISTGDMFREVAKQLNLSVVEFNSDERVTNTDKQVDETIKKLGETSLDDNIIIDSRLAWHFIPNSFKVFLDVTWQNAGKRLLNANREQEQVSSLDEAVKELKNRWTIENARYTRLYKTNNLKRSNYDLVIKTDKLSVEQIVQKIYLEYKKFMQKA